MRRRSRRSPDRRRAAGRVAAVRRRETRDARRCADCRAAGGARRAHRSPAAARRPPRSTISIGLLRLGAGLVVGDANGDRCAALRSSRSMLPRMRTLVPGMITSICGCQGRSIAPSALVVIAERQSRSSCAFPAETLRRASAPSARDARRSRACAATAAQAALSVRAAIGVPVAADAASSASSISWRAARA